MKAKEQEAVVRRAFEAGHFEAVLWNWGHAVSDSREERLASWAVSDRIVELLGEDLSPERRGELAAVAMCGEWPDPAGDAWAERVKAHHRLGRPADVSSPSRAGLTGRDRRR